LQFIFSLYYLLPALIFREPHFEFGLGVGPVDVGGHLYATLFYLTISFIIALTVKSKQQEEIKNDKENNYHSRIIPSIVILFFSISLIIPTLSFFNYASIHEFSTGLYYYDDKSAITGASYPLLIYFIIILCIYYLLVVDKRITLLQESFL
jgi:hypothetical protein